MAAWRAQQAESTTMMQQVERDMARCVASCCWRGGGAGVRRGKAVADAHPLVPLQFTLELKA